MNKLLILLIAFILFSCRTGKDTNKSGNLSKDKEFVISQIDKNKFDFKNINCKFNINFISEKKDITVSGSLRIAKDSIIWASITPALGIEVARIIITKDSFKLINRLSSDFISESINNIDNLINSKIDFQQIQALLIGNIIFSIDKKYTLTTDNNNYKLKNNNKNSNSDYTLTIDSQNFRIVKSEFVDKTKKNKLNTTYSDFRKINELYIPYNQKFQLETDKNIEANIEFTSITIKDSLDFPFNIPKKYKKSSLIK